MRRPQSAQAQKLTSKADARQYKVYSPKGPQEIKLSGRIIQTKPHQNDFNDENLINNGVLHTKKKSDSIFYLASYQHRMRLLQNEIDVLKSQLRLTEQFREHSPHHETQYQIKQYEEEIYRLHSMLDEALQRPHEQKKNQLVSFLSTIQEQKGIIMRQTQQIEALQKEIQNLQQQNLRKSQENQSYLQQQQQLRQANNLQNNQQESESAQAQKNKFNKILQDKDKQIQELNDQMQKQNQKNQAKLMQQATFIEQLTNQIDNKQKMLNIYEEDFDQLKQENIYLSEQLKEMQTQLDLANQEKVEVENKNQFEKAGKNLNFNVSTQIFEYFKEQSQKENAVTKVVNLTTKNQEISQQILLTQNQFQQLKNKSLQTNSLVLALTIDGNSNKNVPLKQKQLAHFNSIISIKIAKNDTQKEIIIEKMVTDYLEQFINSNNGLLYPDKMVDEYLQNTLEKCVQENILIANKVEKYLQQFIC